MAVNLQMRLNEKLFLRDPMSSDIGRKIIGSSIEMIEKMGIEDFTFRKLAIEIESTEATIYRYFENKHTLLVYLVSWYYAWLEYQISVKSMNITDPSEKLRIAIQVLAKPNKIDIETSELDEKLLRQIVIAEGSKAYLTKQVDSQNKEGFFIHYKSLCKAISSVISEIDKEFPYPKTLASNLVEMAFHHLYYALHLPSLTDLKTYKGEVMGLTELLEYFSFGLLRK